MAKERRDVIAYWLNGEYCEAVGDAQKGISIPDGARVAGFRMDVPHFDAEPVVIPVDSTE